MEPKDENDVCVPLPDTFQVKHGESPSAVMRAKVFWNRIRPFVGEFLGTFIMVLFGTLSVSSAVLTGSLQGLWQVASVWGFGVALAIYATGPISGAHLNPAVSLAMAVFKSFTKFSWSTAAGYIVAQALGAVLAGAVNLAVYGPFIQRFETANSIVRGQPGSERSAMIFGEYFPNADIFHPTPTATQASLDELVGPVHALAVEALGTGILTFVIFALTDRTNSLVAKGMEPFFIGFTVAALISIFAPISQAGFNPARDFGPRIVAFFAGWDTIAIPGPRNGFWIYIVGPCIGSCVGGAIFFGLARDIR